MLNVADLLSTCRESLAALARPGGGWGYRPGAMPQVEPTCLTLLALRNAGPDHAGLVRTGLDRLREWQDSDGGLRVRDGREEAVWPTALALFTQTVLRERVGRGLDADRAAGWLLHVAGRTMEDTAEFRADFDIDPRLVGWPWTEGTFSWVEPTAWACLALNRAGWGAQPRVHEGMRLLLDRAFDAGGANYGNRKVFGRMTEPVPTVTALLVLALAETDDHPRLAAARDYLLSVAEHDEDLEHLCWTRLALDRWSDAPDVAATLVHLEERIAAAHSRRQDSELFVASPVRDALTALALSTEEGNPFRLDAVVARAGSVPAPPRKRSGSWGRRLASMVRGWGIKTVGHLRAGPAQSQVHIARAADYQADLAAILGEQYEAFRTRVPLQGKRVVLKPNLVEYHRDKLINTHPHLVAAAIELCRREGAAEVIVAEGPGHWRNTEHLVTASGLGDVLRHYRVPFVDLNHDDPVRLPNLGRQTRLEYLYLARTIATADVLISMPKLKTHHWVGVTLSLKNLFGTLPGICYGWPKNELHWQGIEKSIVDIALTRAPDLAIVDGILGMEGDGPLNGTAVPLGAVAMGTDAVAVDATCCRLMQLDPEKVGYLSLGRHKKLGLLDESLIVQLGESIASLSRPFTTLPRFAHLYATSVRKSE